MNSVHVVVIPAVVVPPGGPDLNFITSGRRRFWPAAYRTVLDVFSDSAVVSWPPVCSYATDGWELEACPQHEARKSTIEFGGLFPTVPGSKNHSHLTVE